MPRTPLHPDSVPVKKIRRPLGGIAPHRLYARYEVEARLGLGKNTLTNWIASGLPVYGDARIDLFFGSDVIAHARKVIKSKEGLREAAAKAAATRSKKRE